LDIPNPAIVFSRLFWWLATPFLRLIAWWLRRLFPEYRGITIACGAANENAALFVKRIEQAIDLLAQYGPRYFRSFTGGVNILLIARKSGHFEVQLYAQVHILRMSPQWVFSHSPEQLALDLIAFAVRLRLRALGIRHATRPRNLRVSVAAIPYRIWLAHRMPGGEPLADYWQGMLVKYAQAYPRPTTSPSVDA
jgi:hypothetical protein